MQNQQKILKIIKSLVISRFPDAKIILYGSRARGEENKDSDWDLLILLNTDKVTNEIERSISYPLYDLELEIGEVISPMIYSEKEWMSKYMVTPFYKNVMREGKQI
jgi:predicted nucleotidyltransferase